MIDANASVFVLAVTFVASTSILSSEVAVLVGNTPVPKYVNWDAHRREMYRAADGARAAALARRTA